ncbi:ABC transporter permease [Labedella endophytica]|jgi:ABC-2 type transport system permease protein|uniref:ABC transporter permease n=1 Tax=Labedella endophytica TaxID=1523160 RepID=A0A3S0X8L2_9MICO|nr:ABC transporter permease [Labedella endophytica]RUR01929.1 ABC transporter permease [Labedella endophytica]
MNTFLPAVRSEVAKITSTRMWWILALVLFVYVLAMAGGLAALLGAGSDGSLPGVTTTGSVPTAGIAPLIYSFASSIGYVFPVLLGALAVTGEVRHQTLTPTFLATPRRGVVLLAKLLVLLAFGALFGVIGLVASVGGGGGVLAAFGIETELGSSDTWAMFARLILAMALWAAVGIGLGSIVTNQVAVIVIVIAFTQFVEPVLRSVGALADWIGDIVQFLPGAASDTLVGTSIFGLVSTGADGLEWWAGALILGGIAAVLTALGALTTWRRDVT